MRKALFFTLILAGLVLGSISTQSQELGLRFGHINGNNVALDGIFSTGEFELNFICYLKSSIMKFK